MRFFPHSHDSNDSRPKRKGIVVIGLGRLGSALALELMHLGHDVLGIDEDPKPVQDLSGKLTHVVSADSTDEEALRQLGVHEMETAVVTINTGLAESVLTVSHLLHFEVPHLWVRARSKNHGRVLEQLGVHRVFFPEHDTGERIAHLVYGDIVDYLAFDENFAMMQLAVPTRLHGTTIDKVDPASGIAIVAIRRGNNGFMHLEPATRLLEGDIIAITGPPEHLRRFSND